jgi:ankyrin repeat protein
MTPIILAAKYNHLEVMKILYELGGGIYSLDNKMQNVLHYAIFNENEEMIKYIVSKDQKFQLRREKNIYG